MMMDNSPPLFLRNLLTLIFIYADKSLLIFVDKFKPFQILRSFLVSSFLFFLQVLPSLFPALNPFYFLKPPEEADDKLSADFRGGGSGNSCIARALSQLLSLMNEIPVNSRKYEVVKSLSEKLIVENILEDCEALSEVNRTVLSAAFSRTLGQLEAAAMNQEGDLEGGTVAKPGSYYGLNRVYRTVRYYGDAWTRLGKLKSELNRSGISAEKLSAELLWLAEKLVACGCAEEAVAQWASASNLAWLALSAGSRLQGSLVKVSAFLFKQAKEMGSAKCEDSKIEGQGKTKMKMLISWLPFLCRARGGIDAPVLSVNEKAELERVLDEIIQSLLEEEQEKVLSLWLHHFTHCPSSDWPNLQSCYERWCIASRKLLIFTASENIMKTSP